MLQGDPATGVPPGDLVVQESGDELVIRHQRPVFTAGLQVGMVLAVAAVGSAWLAAWHFGMGVGMVAVFVTMASLMMGFPLLLGALRSARAPATVRVAGDRVEASHTIGAGTFTAVQQAHTQELGSGSDRYRAISLRGSDNHQIGELRWPGSRATQGWIARRISWFLQGGRGDVPSVPLPGIAAPLPSPRAPIAGTGATVEILLVPHPACRGQVVFGVVFAAFASGFAVLMRTAAGELPVMAMLILGVFLLVGVIFIWSGLRGSTRRTSVRLHAGTLEIEQRDWYARLERTIAASEVVAVRAEPTGTRINDWTVYRLRLVLRDGKRLDLGSQARPEHLKQAAEDLARSLGVECGAVG
jgi:hypothetical protein